MRQLSIAASVFLALALPQTAQTTPGKVGKVDFQVSQIGPPGNDTYTTGEQRIAHNTRDDEFLVVWTADLEEGRFQPNHQEIFGQLLDAQGNEIGRDDFRISVAGAPNTGRSIAPDVVYNPVANEYLVVWSAASSPVSSTYYAYEIYGQRIAADGTEVGADDFPISQFGSTSPADHFLYDALTPRVVFNTVDAEYLVTWYGQDFVTPSFLSYGQRLDGLTGAEVGTNDFVVPSTTLVHNSVANEYLAVYAVSLPFGGTFPEQEIVVQRLSADGTLIDAQPLRISEMGPTPTVYNDGVSAGSATGVHNPVTDEYLIVWRGDEDPSFSSFPPQDEIFVQRLDGATLAEVGIDDHSLTGRQDVGSPSVVLDAARLAYLVVYVRDTLGGREIVGQRLSARGVGPGLEVEVRGASSAPLIGPVPAVGGGAKGDPMVVWLSQRPPYQGNRYDVHGQRLLLCDTDVPSSEVLLPTLFAPTVLLPGVNGGPVVGREWEPVIDHEGGFAPWATLDLLLLVPVVPGNGLGGLLGTGGKLHRATPGSPFRIPIPADCALVGTRWYALGLSQLGARAARPTNVMEIAIGTY